VFERVGFFVCRILLARWFIRRVELSQGFVVLINLAGWLRRRRAGTSAIARKREK
jgi:hypothetical protein